jgi:hypothetical protein
MEGLDLSAVKTYRYLRLSVVGMAFALAVALVIEIATGETGGLLGSISAYYYTPVVGIFVGVLVAAGVSLIAIKGREGAEDIMLNLAGMLAPMVALIPTPISDPVYGLDPNERSVPPELVPTVENNVAAMLTLGLVGVVVAFAWLPRGGKQRTTGIRGLTAGVVLVIAGWLWFLLDRSSFLDYGHYAAAVPMFLLLAAVAVVNALRAPERDAADVRGFTPSQYRTVYGIIAVSMAAVIGIALLMFAGQAMLDWSLPTGWLFLVEALLLAAFSAFWLAQTAENWRLGSPVVDASAADSTTAPASGLGPDGPSPAPA